MKIYIMTDMEGVCGVMNIDEWVMRPGRYYSEGKRLLTLEVNAAVEGFFSAGADEIYVVDGHGEGGIDQSVLDPRTYLVRGCPGPYPFFVDETFDAMAWVGQHAKAGTPYAHLSHTGWFDVLDCTINGVSVGEFGQIAMCGAHFGVRSIFASGDEAFTREAEALTGGIGTVSVKRGLMPGSGDECSTDVYMNRNTAAVHMHPERARALIKAGAEKALKRFIADRASFQLLNLKPPYERVVKYRADGRGEAYAKTSRHPSGFFEMMNQ